MPPGPGAFEVNFSLRPSSGCTLIISLLGSSWASVVNLEKISCGLFLKVIIISLALVDNFLPVLM